MADKPKFSFISKLGEGRVPSKNPIPYDLGELESFIQETAKVAQYHYGLGDVDLRVNYGKYVGGDNVEALAKSEGFASAKDYIKKRNTTNATHRHTNTENYIEMNLDVLWNQEIGKMKSKGLEGVPTIDEFKDSLKELVGHEFRHQWQHEGKTPEARELISKQAKYIKENPMSEIKDYNKKYEVYHNKPFEIDAREQGGYFKNNYEELSKKYKESIGSNTATIDDFKRNTQKFFDDSGASVEDIVNNFDSYFSQAMKETDFSKIDGKALMDYRNELKKSYDNRWTQEAERAAQEKIRQREIEIENRKKNAKASDTEYWNGQKKRDIMDLEDGIKAELFYDENGEVVVQKLLHPDGKRDISVRRTAKDLEQFMPDELDGAKHQISKKRVVRDGNIIEIVEVPDSMYASTKTIDLSTGDVETKHRLRDRPWGGGKQEEKIINSKLKTSNVNNEKPKINNNFRGNKNNRTSQEQFIDKIIGKQNPGDKTSRVFNYGGKEYAIYNNLGINSKDLSKGLQGKVVDLETNKLVEAREAFGKINQALMNGDFDTALNEINSFQESKHTFSKDELNEKIVNTHETHTEQQRENNQEARNRQQQQQQENHTNQQEEFKEARTETKQETKQNHQENHTKVDTPEPDKTKTKPKTIDPDAPTPKTRKQKLERTKGKKLTPGKAKVKTNLRVSKNVKGKNLNQILINTAVNSAINTATETIEEAAETISKTVSQGNWNRTNTIHPSQMDDFQIADLTDDEIKMFANGNDELIEEWTQRRNQSRANQILDSYLDGNTGNTYYGNNEFKNPYEYKIPNMEFEVDADGNTVINKIGTNRTVETDAPKSFKYQKQKALNNAINGGSSNTLDDVMEWMKSHKMSAFNVGLNVFSTVSAYKDSRRKGRSVVSSAVRAAGEFAMFEMLGPLASFGVQIARTVPGAVIKGADLLYKENRKMNSAANNQVFGTAQFYDTQQLATMRQSGMEMAKMAQYNLQQTLMGTEAQYLHR